MKCKKNKPTYGGDSLIYAVSLCVLSSNRWWSAIFASGWLICSRPPARSGSRLCRTPNELASTKWMCSLVPCILSHVRGPPAEETDQCPCQEETGTSSTREDVRDWTLPKFGRSKSSLASTAYNQDRYASGLCCTVVCTQSLSMLCSALQSCHTSTSSTNVPSGRFQGATRDQLESMAW